MPGEEGVELVMADHLGDDESQELLAKSGVELGGTGEFAQPVDLFVLALRISKVERARIQLLQVQYRARRKKKRR